MAKIEDTITALELKLKQAKALRLKQEAKKRAGEKKQARALDTRRKILVGSFFLGLDEYQGENGRWILRDRLDAFLTRDADRELFGLPPLPVAA